MSNPPSVPPGMRYFPTRCLIATATAVIANVCIRIVATELLGVDATYEHLQWRDFISTTVGVVVLATLFRFGLQRFVGHPEPIFKWVAVVVFALSLLGPVFLLRTDDAADAGIVATLVAMHVATAVSVWTFLAAHRLRT